MSSGEFWHLSVIHSVRVVGGGIVLVIVSMSGTFASCFWGFFLLFVLAVSLRSKQM